MSSRLCLLSILPVQFGLLHDLELVNLTFLTLGVQRNPPDLLMVMMDSGNGSSAARAGVFFLSFGFALTACFENICGNAVAGGIDLAGLFPRYVDIRRGALITFTAAWICQPWQLVNRAGTFVSVLSSFSVFLSPIMGIMATDFLLLRKGNIRLSHLYRTTDSSYWFWHGVNWRAVAAWPCGWTPTIGGLVLTTSGQTDGPKELYQLYYMAFLMGTSSVLSLTQWSLTPSPPRCVVADGTLSRLLHHLHRLRHPQQALPRRWYGRIR